MKFAGICNPCDFLLYKYPFLYLWELKSHKGKSIPLSSIREQQLKKLTEIDKEGVSAGFIFNFRDFGETYWVEAMKVLVLRGKEERKSISVEWCRIEGIRIEQSLKRSRYYYDIPRLIKELDSSLSY